MKLESIALHHGYESEKTTKSATTPIYQTTSFTFDDTKHGADLFELKVEGNIYTRIMNPTNGVLEQRVAEMEGGIAALSLASSMAAITYAIQCITRTGDNIVSTNQLYGGTYNLFAHSFPQQGINVKMVDGADFKAIDAAIDEKTKALYCESIGNPLGNIIDLKELADIAHKHGIPLIVDNTVPTPYLCRPIDFGADVVIHSLTKYMGGHGTSLGGIIVDSGNFPWADHADKFPMMTTPEASYHGVVYTEAMGPAAFIGRARTVPLRNTGSTISPFNAFLILQGLETLALRMERHCSNALAVANYLNEHEAVATVSFAGLPDSPYYDLAQKYTNGSPASLLTFEVNGGYEAAVKFYDQLELFKRLVNIGDAKSLACHPSSTTHRQMTPEEQASAGVTAGMIRLCVGIEHIDDIIVDLDQALKAAQ